MLQRAAGSSRTCHFTVNGTLHNVIHNFNERSGIAWLMNNQSLPPDRNLVLTEEKQIIVGLLNTDPKAGGSTIVQKNIAVVVLSFIRP